MIKMSSVMRSSLKLYSGSSFMNLFKQTIKPENAKQRLYSTLWSTGMKSTDTNALKSTAVWNKCSILSNQYSTKSESELAEFLEQEISAEQKLQKHKTIPSKIDDFEVKLDGSEVTLIKTLPEETITVKFNINHSVSDVGQDELDDMNESDCPELSSKPEFEVDIKRGDTTLGFTCSFSEDYEAGSVVEAEDDTRDVFQIDEVTSYKGEWKETNYQVSGAILDGYLYDLLMNFLEEKGVSSEFVVKLSELSTAYEHSSYISLLRDLKKFTSK